MAIQLDPNRIRLAAAAQRKNAEKRRIAEPDAPIVTPSRAHVNHIPAPESLSTLISSAVAALKRGIRWDRGTILNLLV